MAALIFYIIIIFFVFAALTKDTKTSPSYLATYIINSRFSNVSTAYTDYNITLYRGDKSGENFLFAIKNGSSSFSLQDINILYEKAEQLHIHNRILITDFPVDNSSIISKKIKEYEIEIWDSSKLKSLGSSSSASALKTSDTSDDTCDIEEDSTDPIQDGAFKTHGIFSFFNNKTEHL